MRSALVEVPPERLAGVVLLTDGQVHDVPRPDSLPPELGGAPVHALIAGKKNERDRLIVIEQSPRFGVVGREVTAKFKIEDPAGGTAPVTLSVERRGRAPHRRAGRQVGRAADHRRQSRRQRRRDRGRRPARTSSRSTTTARLFTINGVRDRLRVLLVSGEPYQGERAWRNLLKSDPAVDLVHFTILRTPQKDDFTPVRELSLIVFPMRELFEQKLKEFDLIIFDRYESGSLITREYFRNIAEYVKGGGALLVSVGPVFATQRSLYRTPLGAVLPAAPLGDVLETPFKPKVTEIGQRHPVTANLPQAGDPGKEPDWGRWFRLVTSRTERGNAVLSGADERPLVILDRVGEGRVAQLMSDHLWLWNRGIDGGGPQPELVRRIAHWLMKEPDLEEEALRATAVGGRIEVTRRTLAATFPQVTMTAPDGTHAARIDLRQTSPGLGLGVIDVDKPGLYRFDDGTLRTVAAVGNPDPLEFSDVRATDAKLKPLVEASGGAHHVAGRHQPIPTSAPSAPAAPPAAPTGSGCAATRATRSPASTSSRCCPASWWRWPSCSPSAAPGGARGARTSASSTWGGETLTLNPPPAAPVRPQRPAQPASPR